MRCCIERGSYFCVTLRCKPVAPYSCPGRTMSAGHTIQDAGNPMKLQKILSLLTLGIGTVLMIFMITTESEPGLLPLLLVATGLCWYLVTRFRSRRTGT